MQARRLMTVLFISFLAAWLAALPGCGGPQGHAGPPAVKDSSSDWNQTVRDADLKSIVEQMRRSDATPWPAIPSAETAAAQQPMLAVRRELAQALFDKIEALEWQRQRIDDASEAALIRDYTTIAQTLRAAGGYHNHVLAETLNRLALLRLCRWAVDYPRRAPEAIRLLADLKLPALSIATLDELVTEQGGFPDARSARKGPEDPDRDWLLPARYPPATRPPKGPAWTDPMQLPRSEFQAALGALLGQREEPVIQRWMIPWEDAARTAARTRLLLKHTNVPLLLMRLDETETIAACRAGDLLEFLAKGGEFGPNYDQWHDPKGYMAVIEHDHNRVPRPRSQRYEHITVAGKEDVKMLRDTVIGWPRVPLPIYLVAVDSPPIRSVNDLKGKRELAPPLLTEKPLGTLPPKVNAAFSPDSAQWAYADGGTVVVNGTPLAGWWGKIDYITFSPADKLVFKASWLGKELMVIDGKADPAADRIVPSIVPGSQGQLLTFDTTGRHLAYLAIRGGESFVAVDGKEFGPYSAVGPMAFSPTGEHFAWAALAYTRKKLPRMETFLVVDGKPRAAVPRMDSQLVFSPNGRRIAFFEQKDNGGSDAVVIGDRPLRVPGAHTVLAFSPDNQLFTFRSTRGHDGEVLLEGKAICDMKWPGSGGPVPKFSHDGKRIYAGGKLFALEGNDIRPSGVNDREDGREDLLVWFNPRGGEDVIGYSLFNATVFMLPGGRKTRRFGETGGVQECRFLPGDRFVFSATGTSPPGGGTLPFLIVVDGVESQEYSTYNTKSFAATADGKHLIYAAARNGVWRINVDGADSTETYDDVPATGVAVTGPNTFRLLARRGSAVLSVIVTVR